MKIQKITMTNFMPYKGTNEVKLSDDEYRNVTVIVGDNMRGKTSFLNAVRWCFYGKALGRHLNEISLEKLLNTEAAQEGDCRVEVAIEFQANGSSYSLKRTATQKKLVSTATKKEDFEMALGMQKDGAAITSDAIEREINKFVPEQVSRFFLFDGELLQEYESLLVEGSEQGKHIKEAIEQVLGVPSLTRGADELGSILKKFQNQQAKDAAQIKGLEQLAAKQTEWQEKLENFESDITDLKQQLERTREHRRQLDDELEKVESQSSQASILEKNKSELVELGQRENQIKIEKASLLKDSWREIVSPKLLKVKEMLYSEQEQLTLKLQERIKLESNLSNVEEIIKNSVCPTCRKPTDEEKKKEAEIEKLAITETLNATSVDTQGLAELTSRIREIDAIIRVGNFDSIRKLDEELIRIGINQIKIDSENIKIEESIRGFEKGKVAYDRKIRDLKIKEETRLEVNISTVQSNIEKAKRELGIIANSLSSKPGAGASRSTSLVRLTTDVESIFKESIELLRERLKETVQERATNAFKSLTTQKLYSGLKINDNYGLTILDENSVPVKVRSAGAEQIVALSLIDGLARTGRAQGPVIMDTPFGRLDLKHRDNILKYLPTTTGQLILLVHDGEVRLDSDLAIVADRIGCRFKIKEISPRHSSLEVI